MFPPASFPASTWTASPAAAASRRCCLRNRGRRHRRSGTPDHIDGLLVTGGRDVDPAAYGQEAHPATDPLPGVGMHGSSHLSKRRCAGPCPYSEICRGAHSSQCRVGRHSASAPPRRTRAHASPAGSAVFSTSSVHTVAGSRLASLVGAGVSAQCYHHQAIDRLGTDWWSSATDSAGVIKPSK